MAETDRQVAADAHAAPSPVATPTAPGVPRRIGQFTTLTASLDDAAGGACGYNYHDARASLTRAYPYATLRDDAHAHARRLLARGLGAGDRVALIAETSAEFAALFFGAVYAGCLPVPLPMPTSFGGRDSYVDQIRTQLKSCSPTLVLSPEGLDVMVAEAADGIAPVLRWDVFTALPAPDTALPQADPDAIAYLQYSSGSTRFPHGVAVTHRALMANLAGHATAMQVRDGDRVISWLPLYHDMGLVGCMLSPMAAQLSVDFLATDDFARRPLSWLTLVSRHAGTTLSYSPSFGYDICARRVSSQTDVASRFDLSRWRVAGNGADMIRPDVCQAFADAFAAAGFDARAFLPSYGLAEATLAVSIMPPGEGIVIDLVDERLLSGEGLATLREQSRLPRPIRYRSIVNCGRPVLGLTVEIVGDDNAVLGDRQIGRLRVRGLGVMQGYFRDDGATHAVLSPDGWLDTGDMAYLADGYVHIVGRAKDMIILNGKNHWPQDIEWAIEQLPGFKAGDIAAFSVTTPAGEEAPAVLVQCRTTDADERARLRDEIRGKVRALTGMSCVVELVPPRTLPRTSSGKLSRTKARSLYLSGAIQPFDVAA